MKKLIFFNLLILNSLILFAQAAPVVTAPGDSAKLKATYPVKTEDIKSSVLPTSSIADNIASVKTFSKFFNAVQAAGLNETFKSKGPITVFVPDDNAFGKITPGKLDTLLRADHKPDLIAFITYHAIPGQIKSKDIARQIRTNKNLATFTTLAGSKLMAKIDDNRNIILIDENGGQSTISRFDIEQNNGILFIINSVLIPKSRLL
ncbi:MAG TPA: fasciclin domain-containing protein [Mucilaginibacter sp.]